MSTQGGGGGGGVGQDHMCAIIAVKCVVPFLYTP